MARRKQDSVTETVTKLAADAQNGGAVGRDEVDEQLVRQLASQAQADGAALTGPDGLGRLTKVVLETGLEAELSEHLATNHMPSRAATAATPATGARPKTVTTDVGPLQIEVPRDRDGSFDPTLVRKRQRRLEGVDELVCSLTAKGLTTGEVSAHLAEVYGAEVCKDTVSRITDRVLEGMTEWQNRPLDPRRILVNDANPDREDSECRATRRTRLRWRRRNATSN